MVIFADIFAGLGLFFIGIRLISSHFKQLAGRRMRLLITRALQGRGSAPLLGLAAGALLQSVNAVVYVLVALVTAGAIDKRRAFPIISWANIGTSALVIAAALNMHLMVLLLIGATGVTYYLSLDQSPRYRHLVGALLGIGLLFLGIDFIKSASAVLKHSDELRETLAVTAQYPVLSFGLGVAVAWVVQSSSTITVITMAMSSAGLLSFDAGALLVLGAGLGSPLSTRTLAARLTGSERQLVLYQIALKSLGVAVSLLLYASDRLLGLHAVVGVLDAAGLSPAARLAAVYVALQLASELAMQLFRRPVLAYLERLAPPSHEEVLGRPHYLRDGVLAESESALLLVDKEQQRLLRSLESYLAPLRAEARSDEVTVAVRHAAERQVLRECDHFLTEVADRNHSRQTLERTIVLRDRNELLDSLQDTLAEMVRAVEGPGADAAVRQHIDGLVEDLHMMLETLADVAEQPTDDDLALVRTLTHDRSELMDGIRRRLQGGAVAPDVQQAVFTVTALFERSMWLLRRYALLLDVAGSEMA